MTTPIYRDATHRYMAAHDRADPERYCIAMVPIGRTYADRHIIALAGPTNAGEAVRYLNDMARWCGLEKEANP